MMRWISWALAALVLFFSACTTVEGTVDRDGHRIRYAGYGNLEDARRLVEEADNTHLADKALKHGKDVHKAGGALSATQPQPNWWGYPQGNGPWGALGNDPVWRGAQQFYAPPAQTPAPSPEAKVAKAPRKKRVVQTPPKPDEEQYRELLTRLSRIEEVQKALGETDVRLAECQANPLKPGCPGAPQ